MISEEREEGTLSVWLVEDDSSIAGDTVVVAWGKSCSIGFGQRHTFRNINII